MMMPTRFPRRLSDRWSSAARGTADERNLRNIVPHDGERLIAQSGQQAIRDGRRRTGRNDASFFHALGGVVGERGFTTDDGCMRTQVPHDQRGATQKPTTADRGQHGVQVRDIGEQFECGRSLARDNACIIVRMDHAGAGRLHHSGGSRFTGGLRWFAKGNLAAIAFDRNLLHLRRGAWHHDIRGDAALLRRQSQRSRVIAR
jgi:hypothetical protein